MATKNPYLAKVKVVPTAWIDPKTGNMSIVNTQGGDATPYQQKRADEFISQGYVAITDPDVIKKLQTGVLNTSTFKTTQDWQDYFAKVGALVTAPTQAERDAAKARLEQYEAYKQESKPVTTPVPLAMPTSSSSGGMPTSSSSGGGSSSGNMSVSSPSYTPSRPSLRSIEDLAALYGGITYDEAAIRAKFDAATKAEYDLKRREYEATANRFYEQMYGTQATALDTIRRNNAAAVATGASRGIQAANELSAILGLQETNTQTASELARQRNLLADQEGAAYAKNIVDAMTTSNAVKQALANLAANIYATDTQFDVGAMQYYAALNQAAQALQGTIYTADRNLDASRYAADQNLAGVQYTADKNVEAARVTAKGNVDAADVAGSWNLKAADRTGYWNNQAAATAGQYNVEAADRTGYWNNQAAATAGQYNVQAADRTGYWNNQAAATAGRYNVQAAQASNAAQAAYYEYLKTQEANNDFITQWAKICENYAAALKAGDIDTAAQWLMAMGMDYKEAYKEAEKAYKKSKNKTQTQIRDELLKNDKLIDQLPKLLIPNPIPYLPHLPPANFGALIK